MHVDSSTPRLKNLVAVQCASKSVAEPGRQRPGLVRRRALLHEELRMCIAREVFSLMLMVPASLHSNGQNPTLQSWVHARSRKFLRRVFYSAGFAIPVSVRPGVGERRGLDTGRRVCEKQRRLGGCVQIHGFGCGDY